jgi:ribosome maturation factor RimP
MPTPPASTTARATLLALRALAEPVVERNGCELVAIELGGSGMRVLRFSVDRTGGATIEDCTRISRQLSPALDVADLIATAYQLEVSTPGMERPVQREKDFVYFAGCTVRVKTFGSDGRRRLKGVIRGVVEGYVELDVEGELRRIPLEDVERANLDLDLDQYARMGEGLHPLAERQPGPVPGEPPHGDSA